MTVRENSEVLGLSSTGRQPSRWPKHAVTRYLGSGVPPNPIKATVFSFHGAM